MHSLHAIDSRSTLLGRTLQRVAVTAGAVTLALATLAPAAAAQQSYTVAPGDTLSSIAGAHEMDWRRLFDANPAIADPNVIFPGQVLVIPAADAQVASRSRSEGESASRSSAGATASSGSTVWDRLAECESGGNWSINTGNGYYGGLQFSLSSWRAVGGSGLPSEASREEQIARAEQLLARQGWGAWPACSRELGLR